MEVGNFFLYQESFSLPRKNFFPYTYPMFCAPKLLRPLIAAQCIPIAGTCPVPLAQNATEAPSGNCPYHWRGCVPQQANTPPACLPPPGSQHGALPVHAVLPSLAHHTQIHTWVPQVPLGLCLSEEHQAGEHKRTEDATGKRKRLQCYKEEEKKEQRREEEWSRDGAWERMLHCRWCKDTMQVT